MSVDVAHQFRGEGHLADVFVSELLKTRVAAQWPSGLRADPVERGAANAPTVVTQNGGDDLLNEVRLAFRALIEQVRLVLRDGRRLIRRLIAVCDTPRGSSSVEMTNSPAPLASVPLVVLRSTTEREQIELNDLVQSLSAEGYQVTRRGPQWVVYTEITDRRTSVIGRSPQDGRGTAAVSERVRRGSRRQCRSDDRPQ